MGLIPAAAMYIPQLPASSRSVQQATWEPNLTKTDLKLQNVSKTADQILKKSHFPNLNYNFKKFHVHVINQVL